MKRALLIPLQYLLLLLLLTGLISAYSIIVGAAVYEQMSDTSSQSLLLINLIQGLKFGLYIGGLLATLISLNSILRLPSHRFVALLLLFVIVVPVLFFGYFAVRTVETDRITGDTEDIIDLPSESIVNFPGGGLYYHDSEAGSLNRVVVYHFANLQANPLDESDRNFQLSDISDPDAPRLVYAPRVIFDSTDGEIIINQRSPYTGSDGRALVIQSSDVLNSRSALFGQTGILVNIGQSISGLFNTLDEYADELSYRYLALVLSLMLYLFSTWVFLRLTRWPMINFIMAVIANVFGLLITRVTDLYFVQELAGSFLQERAFAYVSPALLTFFALLFLIYNSFLPSVSEWYREIQS